MEYWIELPSTRAWLTWDREFQGVRFIMACSHGTLNQDLLFAGPCRIEMRAVRECRHGSAAGTEESSVRRRDQKGAEPRAGVQIPEEGQVPVVATGQVCSVQNRLCFPVGVATKNSVQKVYSPGISRRESRVATAPPAAACFPWRRVWGRPKMDPVAGSWTPRCLGHRRRIFARQAAAAMGIQLGGGKVLRRRIDRPGVGIPAIADLIRGLNVMGMYLLRTYFAAAFNLCVWLGHWRF
jgi:hypothetical protein